MKAVVLLLAAAAPFILWPVEILAPYPYIIEEVFKLALVLVILNERGPAFKKITLGVTSGVLFAFSESFLYFLNIFQTGQPSLFVQRLIFTIPLHGATIMLMILPVSLSQGGPALRKKWFVFVGFLLAVALHYFYNLYILKYFGAFIR
jgi:RsiW-degrading membrane proteinase PrsW (M82 family)